MRTKYHQLPVLAALITLPWLQASVCQAYTPYHFLKEITVGGEGGWHGLSIDEGGRRLYVAHENRIEVIDIEKDQAVGAITNTPGVCCIGLAPQFHYGEVTSDAFGVSQLARSGGFILPSKNSLLRPFKFHVPISRFSMMRGCAHTCRQTLEPRP